MARVLLSAAAAALLSISAAAARADVVMTFQVDVTSAPGLADFSPFSFLETWTIAPDGSASVDDGDALIAGMKGVEGASASYTANVAYLPGQTRDLGSSPWSFGESAVGGAFAFDQTLTTGALGAGPGDGLIGNDFAAFIAAGRLLTFVLTGPRATTTVIGEVREPGGAGQTEFISQRYLGTALVVDNPAAAIPEPASWALAILGFGGVGAALRSRRRLATA